MIKKSKIILGIILLMSFSSGVAVAEQKDFEHKNKEIQERIKKISNKKVNKKSLTEALEMNKNNPFKIPTMIMPKRSVTETSPEERANQVNADEIEKNRIKIAKKSKNMANAYSFLATYGIKPREKGNLPGEKELYKLIKEKKIKVSSRRVQESRTKIKPYNMFQKFNK